MWQGPGGHQHSVKGYQKPTGKEEEDPDGELEGEVAGGQGHNQYIELQRLEEQWELLRQQMVGSPHWQAGRGLEQVNGEWGFDEPNWQMGEAAAEEE